MIELKNLRKEYERATPLQDVSVTINEGDVIAVIGPSGTGKSTLLRCINQLEKPTSGRVFLDGEEITDQKCDICKARQKMGMVFQSFNLFGHLSVIENIMLPQIDLLGRSRQEAYDVGVELLRRVGMAKKTLNYPDMLSGGQKQRVAIARTLAMDPEIILFDEPTSALDPSMVGEVQSVIRDLAQSGKTMMIVTHDMRFARSIATRVFYMDEGGIYEDGTPEQIFEHPQKEKTRRFIRSIKVLEFEIDSPDFDFPEAGTKINHYCNKNQVPHKLGYRLQLAFEELIRQILLPVLDPANIHVTIEYAAVDEKVTFTAKYSGDRFDPADSENTLSYTLLNKMAAIEYSYEPGEQANVVTLRLG